MVNPDVPSDIQSVLKIDLLDVLLVAVRHIQLVLLMVLAIVMGGDIGEHLYVSLRTLKLADLPEAFLQLWWSGSFFGFWGYS